MKEGYVVGREETDHKGRSERKMKGGRKQGRIEGSQRGKDR